MSVGPTAVLAHAPSALPVVAPCCPNCGVGLHDPLALHNDARRRIAELESEVELLTTKATAAVDKLADYEDEIRKLRSASLTSASDTALVGADGRASIDEAARPPSAAGGTNQPTSTAAARTSILPVQNRLSYFLSRKATPPPPVPAAAAAAANGQPSTTELAAALAREQNLRQAAEGKLTQANGELEELSAALFQQANEMVASERKARAKLEERVALLERRDGEKRLRLERLEGAVKRIERIRGLLNDRDEKRTG